MPVAVTKLIRPANPRNSNTDSVSQTDRAAAGPQPDNTPATGGGPTGGGGGGGVTSVEGTPLGVLVNGTSGAPVTGAAVLSLDADIVVPSSIATSIMVASRYNFPLVTYPGSGTVTINIGNQNRSYIPMTGNVTIALASISQDIANVIIVQNTTGGALTLTYPAWAVSGGGTLPASLSAGAWAVFYLEPTSTTIGSVVVSYAGGGGSSSLFTPTIAAMRLLSAPAAFAVVSLGGYYNAGDGGGGEFYWDASSTTADNTGTIIKITAVATGRFYRIAAQTFGNTAQGQTIDVRWFGAIPDGAVDCAPPTLAAFQTFVPGVKGACLYFPGGGYVFSTKLTISSGLDWFTIKGDGFWASQWLYAISGASDSIFTCNGQVEMLDMGITSLVGTQTATNLLNFTGAAVRLSRFQIKEAPNNYLIRHTGTGFFTDVKVESANAGCMFFADGGRPVYRNIEAGSGGGILPAVVVRATGGGSITVPQIQNCYFKGQGKWNNYDGGVADIGMVFSGESGTINEGQISGLVLDTTSGVGNPVGSISLLLYAKTAPYGIANFTLSDLWLNSGRTGLQCVGIDNGGSKSVKGMMCSNLITRPQSSFGVYLESVRSIKLTGLATLAVNTGAIGVGITNTGANDTSDIIIEGAASTTADSLCDYGLQVLTTTVKSVTARLSALYNVSAYIMSGGANKLTQDITVQWNDGAGGVNFSGPVNQNV